MNEYHEKFEELRDQDTFRGQQWFGKRKELVDQYSWAVPNEQALIYLSEFENLIEVGAGNGYWAKCIEDCGGSVRATDIDPPQETWTTVEQVDANFIDMEGEAILTVWPPYEEEVASLIPKKGANHIIYVGEERGGCTGDEAFHDSLHNMYGLAAKIDIPSYEGINDNLFHYIRKI